MIDKICLFIIDNQDKFSLIAKSVTGEVANIGAVFPPLQISMNNYKDIAVTVSHVSSAENFEPQTFYVPAAYKTQMERIIKKFISSDQERQLEKLWKLLDV